MSCTLDNYKLMDPQIMRLDTSMDSLNVTRSESVTDLNSELNGLAHTRRASIGHGRNEDNLITSPSPVKPFGIGENLSNYILYIIESFHIFLFLFFLFVLY